MAARGSGYPDLAAIQPFLKIPILQSLAQLVSIQAELCIDMLGMGPDGLVGNAQHIGYFVASVSQAGQCGDLLLALREGIPDAGVFVLVLEGLHAGFEDVLVDILFPALLVYRDLLHPDDQLIIPKEDARILLFSPSAEKLP